MRMTGSGYEFFSGYEFEGRLESFDMMEIRRFAEVQVPGGKRGVPIGL
jgi:hypothetical protein